MSEYADSVAPWSILRHPEWPEIRRYFRVERYDRDRGWAGRIRHRVEVRAPDHPSVRAWLLNVVWYCVKCGEPVHRIRERGEWRTLYFAAGHPLTEKFSCSRGREAAAEYALVVEDLATDPPDPALPQLSLPFGR